MLFFSLKYNSVYQVNKLSQSNLNIEQRYERVVADIRTCCRESGRHPDEIQLLGVSKQQPVSAIRELAALGLRDFGENYLQEVQAKQAELSDLELNWHFIGAIQSNKTREIANGFDWVHSVDRIKIASRLSHQRTRFPPLNVCLQINIDREINKAGIDVDKVELLASEIRDLPKLRLRGLMAIPEPTPDYESQREKFAQVRTLLNDLNQKLNLQMDTLSMGMSGDMAAAIAEGATIVRIGTALFGPRSKS